jgi:hypothetical protein
VNAADRQPCGDLGDFRIIVGKNLQLQLARGLDG